MSWKNSRVYASVISRDGSRKSRSDNALLQVLEKKDFSTLYLPSNNEKTQRFVMMSWTRVHLGVWPKSALLTPPHNIMRINQLQLPRDLRKICLAIIGQHLASTIYKSRSLDFFYDFDEIPLGFTAAKQKKQCIVCLWLSIIFQTWGPFKYFVVSSSSLRALWGACHRHNWGLCINSDWSYDCSIVGHKVDIRHVGKKQRDDEALAGENISHFFC